MTTNDFNQDARKWTADTRRKMKRAVVQLTTQYSGASRSQLKSSNKSYHGEVNQVGFSFPYYMVFVHKGAGRGYGGQGFLKGNNLVNEFTSSNGSKRTTNASSIGKMGTGRRIPAPWFNPVIEESFPVLADLVATYHGGKQIDNLQRLLIR